MKTIIITGGNRGLGYECARHVAQTQEWHILIACRDLQQAQLAVERLQQQTRHPSIEAWPLDLASLKSVNAFVDRVQASPLPPLGALICNAGIQVVSGTQRTQDGFEMTFGVNHLGHYLLVNRLLGDLRPPARIVFVSSDTHDPAKKTGMPEPCYTDARSVAFPNEMTDRHPIETGLRRYTTSKLANVLTTYELARRLAKRGIVGVTVNAFNPGLMPGTGLARDYSPLIRFAWKYILPLLILVRPSVKRVEDSGAALARLILDPTLATTTGRYFSGTDMIPSSTESYEEAKAAELWTTSAQLVGIDI